MYLFGNEPLVSSSQLWAQDISEDSFEYTKEEFAIAGAVLAAEFYDSSFIEAAIFPRDIAFNCEAVGYWRGQLVGIVSFVGKAAIPPWSLRWETFP